MVGCKEQGRLSQDIVGGDKKCSEITLCFSAYLLTWHLPFYSVDNIFPGDGLLDGRTKVEKEDGRHSGEKLAEMEPATKKARVVSKQMPVVKEAAIEAEVHSARERATVPLETRMLQFRGLLQEKQVSAFSSWEKELSKIVFDPRYLLLTSRERKTVFDKYVRERADEERKEKKAKAKERKENFVELCKEVGVTAKSS